ncbi:MAG: winged helix-turn-helix domain-containing protein, partial [Terriglobales bacterium]
GGKAVRLLPREFSLLEFLMRHPDRVFTPEQLMSHVWGKTEPDSIEALRTCVKRLRQKLSDEEVVETVHGVGYKMRS